MSWKTKAKSWIRDQGSDYDWGDSWEDEWESYANDESRLMFDRGEDITRGEFESAWDEWNTDQSAADVREATGDVRNAANTVTQQAQNYSTRVDYSNGYPVVQVSNDGGATWQDQQSYEDAYGKLNDLMNTEFQTFDEFGGEELSGYREGFQGMLDTVSGGPSDEDYQNSLAYAARMLGFESPEALLGQFQNDRTELEAGINNQQGYTPEELQARQKATYTATKEMQDLASITNDSITKNTMMKLAHADEARQQISDYRAKQKVQIIEENFQRQMINYENLKDRYYKEVQLGNMTSQQYIEALRQDRYTALQGYAQGIASVQQAYANETAALANHANIIYESINAQLGINVQAIEFAQAQYDMHMQPFLDSLNAEMTGLGAAQTGFNMDLSLREFQMGQDVFEHEKQQQVFDNVLAGIGTAVDVSGAIADFVEIAV